MNRDLTTSDSGGFFTKSLRPLKRTFCSIAPQTPLPKKKPGSDWIKVPFSEPYSNDLALRISAPERPSATPAPG